MKRFDGRHRWGTVFVNGSVITRTCTVCGRTDSMETLIPQALVDALLRENFRANPYRSMFR